MTSLSNRRKLAESQANGEEDQIISHKTRSQTKHFFQSKSEIDKKIIKDLEE